MPYGGSDYRSGAHVGSRMGWDCNEGPSSPVDHKGEGEQRPDAMPVEVGETAHVETPVDMGNQSGGEWEQKN